jgi:hypothetical protein
MCILTYAGMIMLMYICILRWASSNLFVQATTRLLFLVVSGWFCASPMQSYNSWDQQLSSTSFPHPNVLSPSALTANISTHTYSSMPLEHYAWPRDICDGRNRAVQLPFAQQDSPLSLNAAGYFSHMPSMIMPTSYLSSFHRQDSVFAQDQSTTVYNTCAHSRSPGENQVRPTIAQAGTMSFQDAHSVYGFSQASAIRCRSSHSTHEHNDVNLMGMHHMTANNRFSSGTQARSNHTSAASPGFPCTPFVNTIQPADMPPTAQNSEAQQQSSGARVQAAYSRGHNIATSSFHHTTDLVAHGSQEDAVAYQGSKDIQAKDQHQASAPQTTASVKKGMGKQTVVQMLMAQHQMHRGYDADHPITTEIADFFAPAVHYLIGKGVFFANPPPLNQGLLMDGSKVL